MEIKSSPGKRRSWRGWTPSSSIIRSREPPLFHLSRASILLSPQGRPFDQKAAERLAALPGFDLVCGRYEGFDERIREVTHAEEISLGDFVLSGGEVAALAVTEAAVPLVPGVLGDQESAGDDSFATGLLEGPQYTRPRSFRGLEVPEVLLSGFGLEDTHSVVNSLRWGQDGCLNINQSIYIHSHIETPHGVKHLDGGGILRFRPETMELLEHRANLLLGRGRPRVRRS